MKNYFDLNKRAAAGLGIKQSLLFPAAHSVGLGVNQGLPPLAAPSDIHAAQIEPLAKMPPPPPTQPQLKKMSFTDQLLMYFGLLIGVMFSSAVQQLKSGETVSLNITLGTLLAAAVVALVIIPVVFEKLSISPDAPFLVRFGLFVQNGVFWHVIAGSIGKIISTTAANSG